MECNGRDNAGGTPLRDDTNPTPRSNECLLRCVNVARFKSLGSLQAGRSSLEAVSTHPTRVNIIPADYSPAGDVLMLRSVLASSRYLILIAIIATFIASLALLLYQATVVIITLVGTIQQGHPPESAKRLAVGVIEMMDVFLIAIVAEIMSIGLYTLFIDDTVPLPRWLKMDNLEDLKRHLVSVVIVVIAVLFLREAVERAADFDLLKLGAALALMIVALTFFLTKMGGGAVLPPKTDS